MMKKSINELEQFLSNGITADSVYSALFETTENLTLIFDENTIILKTNSRFAELIGYSRYEVDGKMSWMDFVVKEDHEMMLKYNALRSRSPENAPKNYEFRVKNRDNKIFLMYMTIGMIPGTKYRIASLMDITERRELEKEIIHIAEEEQRRIGFLLHDDLAPQLLGIEALIKVAKKKLEKEKMITTSDVESVRKLVFDAAQKTRGFAKVLCPVHLAEYGLESAIMDLVRNTEEMYGVKCDFVINRVTPDWNNDISKHIFYIVKEAAHNAVKHARADKISIIIDYNKTRAIVKISDNGRGFNVSKTVPGIGLKIMKYRAEMIGAFIEVTSVKNEGTVVLLEIQRLAGFNKE